jgi:hypothetical protein
MPGIVLAMGITGAALVSVCLTLIIREWKNADRE